MRSSRRRSVCWSVISCVLVCVFSYCAFAQAPAQSPQLNAAWTAAVRSLAEKIATDAAPTGSAPSALATNLTNTSSLSGADASAVYDALLAALRARRFNIVSPEPPGGPDTRVQVTLSENAEAYVWIAEIWPGLNSDRGGEREVAMVSAPHGANGAENPSPASVILSRKPIWTQAAKILDFAVLNEPQATELAVLESERVAIYRADGGSWRLDRAVALAHSGVWRDMTGRIDPMGGTVSLFGAKCEGDVLHLDQLHCQPNGAANLPRPVSQMRMTGGDPGPDTIAVGAACASVGPMLLAPGAGDWTQSDDLKAYEQNSMVRAVGQMEFAGPILMLRGTADGKSARVVWRNLQTGMYEAAIVSISCGN